MIRVAFVTESKSVWGAERSLLTILEHLDRTAIDPVVIVWPGSPLIEDLRELGIDYIEHRFAVHPALQSGGSLRNASILTLFKELGAVSGGAIRLARIVRRFDVVVSFSLWQAPELRIAAWLSRVRFVLDLHETFGGSAGRRIVAVLGRSSAAVVAPSLSILRDNEIATLPQAICIPRAVVSRTSPDRTSTGNSQYVIGMFGQVVPHKGIHHVLDALESDGVGDVALRVVGGTRSEVDRSDYERDVRARIGALRGDSIMIDRVADPMALMAECTFVLNASDHEAFGRTMLEAVQVGAYPVSFDGGGPAEIIAGIGVGRVLSGPAALPQLLRNIRSGALDGPVATLRAEGVDLSSFSPATIGHRYGEALLNVAS